MGGQRVSEDLRKVVVHMSVTLRLDINNIMALTRISRRTIERILTHYRKYGQAGAPQPIELRGRKRALEYGDLAVRVVLFFVLTKE
jgi:transposase